MVFSTKAQNVSSVTVPYTITGTGFQPGDTVSGCTSVDVVSATEITAQCPLGTQSVTVTNPCTTAPFNVWTPYAFQAQTANFEVQFDATPSTADQDGVIGFGTTAATASTGYAAFPISIRFNDTGTIDARNGESYTAVTTVGYTVGAPVHFTLDVNESGKVFSLSAGTTVKQTIASNYAFRTGATSTSPISAMTLIVGAGATSGNLKICNFTLSAYTAPQFAVKLDWNESSPSDPVAGFNVYRGVKSNGPYTKVNSILDATTTFVDSTVADGGTYFYVVTAVDKSNKESTDSNQVTVTIPAS